MSLATIQLVINPLSDNLGGEFRLVVDEVSQPPTSRAASEMVAPHSAKDRTVAFVINEKIRAVGFKIGEAGEVNPRCVFRSESQVLSNAFSVTASR